MTKKTYQFGGLLLNRIKRIGFSPLYRNAYILIGSNLLTAFAGYLFWIIGARRFSDISIGIASALFSTMMLLGLVSDLGFGVGLIRILPEYQGNQEGNAFINRVFTMRLLVVTVVTIIFLIGIPWWTPGLNLINQNFILWFTFLFLVLLNGLFTLSYSVFVALRSATYVFLSVIIFNFTKIILVLVSPTSSELFILIFSVVLALLVTITLELFIFLPKIKRGYRPKVDFHFSGSNHFLTYSAYNQIANVLIQLPVLVLPLVVLNLLGPQANAQFYLAFMTAGLLRTAGMSISQSTFAESSYDSENLFKNLQNSLLLCLLIVGFGGICLYFLAPWFLLSFGKDYSEQGTILLRWLIISVLPFVLINLYFIVYRVRRNLKILLISSIIWAVISIGFSIVGIRMNDLHGLVIGWTVGQFISLVLNGLIFYWYLNLNNLGIGQVNTDDQVI